MKEDITEFGDASVQRGVKGHVIVYPQYLLNIAESLPPSIEDIASPICVLFVEANKPSDKWLREHTRPLAVNTGRVRRALVWLKANNALYKNIMFNKDVLMELEQNPALPIAIQHILPSNTLIPEILSHLVMKHPSPGPE